MGKAHQLFNNWMYHYLFELEAWKVSKEEGGCENGSLMQLIYDIHQNSGVRLRSFSNAREDFIKKAIEQKVNYYFNLFDSIREKGYVKSQPPPIICYFMNNKYYLTGGHHRVSALYVLGIKNVYVQVINRDQ
jgi:ParB-like nuclease family protein